MDGASAEKNFFERTVPITQATPLWQLCDHGAECQMHHTQMEVVVYYYHCQQQQYHNDEQSPS